MGDFMGETTNINLPENQESQWKRKENLRFSKKFRRGKEI
jgi:hypothetical protein